jgi:hypothetical protein
MVPLNRERTRVRIAWRKALHALTDADVGTAVAAAAADGDGSPAWRRPVLCRNMVAWVLIQ